MTAVEEGALQPPCRAAHDDSRAVTSVSCWTFTARFKKANEVDPKHIQSVFNLGVVYTDQGQKDLATQTFNRVIQMDAN